MARLLPIIFITALLYGCPDTKVPKIPPKVPEPKLQMDNKKRGDMVVSPPEHHVGTQFAEPRVPAL